MKKDYYDDWVQYLNDDERKVYEEVMNWENKPEHGSTILQTLSASIMSEMKKLSPEILTATVDTTRELLKTLRDHSQHTINEEAISYKISLKLNKMATPDQMMEKIPVSVLDEAARDCANFNIGASCISGGLTGMFGFGGVLIDLPVLYGLLFRLIQETAICYGYRIDTPEEKLYILKILELGHLPEDDSKRSTITEIHSLHTAIRGGVSLNQLEMRSLLKGFNEISAKIGLFYSRRKIIFGLMVLGGITGACMNYFLARQISNAAYHTYRKRFIMDRAMARRLKRI